MNTNVTAVVRTSGELILSWHETRHDDWGNAYTVSLRPNETRQLAEPTTAAADTSLAGLGYRAVKWYPIETTSDCVASARVERAR
jgi:hypothetical protein